MYDKVFKDAEPLHEKHGFGKMPVGNAIKISVADAAECKRLQVAVGGYGKYHKKRFQTVYRDGFLFIKRIS